MSEEVPSPPDEANLKDPSDAPVSRILRINSHLSLTSLCSVSDVLI